MHAPTETSALINMYLYYYYYNSMSVAIFRPYATNETS